MSYNIDSWEQIECSLTIPIEELEAHYDLSFDRPTADGVRFESDADVEDGEITGMLVGETATITAAHLRGSGSGNGFRDLFMAMLSHTTGLYSAVLVWEGGDSITHLVSTDGVVTNAEIDIPALLREVTELRKRPPS